MSSKSRKTPAKKGIASRIRGRDPTDQLYRAVVRYIESKGGKLMVIGGVQIQQWPDDLKYNFSLAVRCTGRMPQVSADSKHG